MIDLFIETCNDENILDHFCPYSSAWPASAVDMPTMAYPLTFCSHNPATFIGYEFEPFQDQKPLG
jgi:hypothetical protein